MPAPSLGLAVYLAVVPAAVVMTVAIPAHAQAPSRAATVRVEPVQRQSSDNGGTQRAVSVFLSNGAKVGRIGGSRSVLHPGFGMAWQRPNRLGVGFDVGPRFEDHDPTRLDDVMVAVEASYQLRQETGRRALVPFVSGGFALGLEPVFDGVQTTFVTVGGGLTYWIGANRGLRVDVRDAVTLDKPDTGYHYVGFRVAYVWRAGGGQ